MSDIKIDIHKCVAPETGYWAEIPSMPGCITCADSLADLKNNIIEAAQCWIAMKAQIAFDKIHANSPTGELQYA